MSAAAMLSVPDWIRDGVRLAIPQPTEWQRIGNQIDAAMIFARDGMPAHRKSEQRRDDHAGAGFRKWAFMLVELLVTCRLIWWVRPISSFPLFVAAFSRLLDRPFNNFDGRNHKQNGSVVIHRVTNKGLYL